MITDWKSICNWDRQPAFIVGGGSSLSNFDFKRLKGKNVVGCNEAFRLGPAICPVTFFSDVKWFRDRRHELREYHELGGEVFTHCEKLKTVDGPIEWLRVARRIREGLHYEALGFGTNSAVAAVNLALNFGATEIFLLGIDCNRSKEGDKSHWHPHYGDRTTTDPTFAVFQKGWNGVARDLPIKFPLAEIINLNPDSGLDVFPKMPREKVLGEELLSKGACL